jgi:hypothetical protein
MNLETKIKKVIEGFFINQYQSRYLIDCLNNGREPGEDWKPNAGMRSQAAAEAAQIVSLMHGAIGVTLVDIERFMTEFAAIKLVLKEIADDNALAVVELADDGEKCIRVVDAPEFAKIALERMDQKATIFNQLDELEESD